MIANYFISLESVAININKLKKLDYSFDAEFSHISDFDLITRVSTKGDAKYIDEILTGWRIHDNNESFINNHFMNITYLM